jgi:hypothetical protein
MRQHHVQAEIFDLEFTLKFPTIGDIAANSKNGNGEDIDSQSDATIDGLPVRSSSASIERCGIFLGASSRRFGRPI